MEKLNKDIVCIGTSGTLKLFVNKQSGTTDKVPALTISYDKDLAPVPTVEGKYELIATPMTFNQFDWLTTEQSEIMTAVLWQNLTDVQVKEINTFLKK